MILGEFEPLHQLRFLTEAVAVLVIFRAADAYFVTQQNLNGPLTVQPEVCGKIDLAKGPLAIFFSIR
jgi:hypothetical protein